jgi:hypothetical protein
MDGKELLAEVNSVLRKLVVWLIGHSGCWNVTDWLMVLILGSAAAG